MANASQKNKKLNQLKDAPGVIDRAFRWANPARFMAISKWLAPLLGLLALLFMAVGLYKGFTAPLEEEMGETFRIMFIHVPSAWVSMMAYGLVAVSSFGYLVFRHPLADISAKAAVPLGAAFTFMTLTTGSLWGKPDWGTYWQWDARMTTVLILFLLYIGLMVLRAAVEDMADGAKLVAILAIFGVVLLPIIKYSVVFWNSLHQGEGIMKGEVSSVYLIPLLLMALGWTFLFFCLHLKNMRAEIYAQRIKADRKRRAARAESNFELSE